MSEPAILTRNLVQRFGNKIAVDRLDLIVQPGGIVALVGPNGAGKTTLLNLLLGLLEPTAGTAELLGHPARRLPADVTARRQAVGDRHEPPGYVRLRELVALQAAACSEFDVKVCTQLLMDHELSPFARFGTLSKGQRRWVLSALALASWPQVLLMDEPADGLDPAARRLLYEHLRHFVNELGATVIVASHVLSDLERVADEVVVMRRGRIALHDSLETLREETRELCLGHGEPVPAWLEHFQTIAERHESPQRQLWIRLRDATEVDRVDSNVGNVALEQADQHSGVSHVNLESLYFALTAAELPSEPPALASSEVQPCI